MSEDPEAHVNLDAAAVNARVSIAAANEAKSRELFADRRRLDWLEVERSKVFIEYVYQDDTRIWRGQQCLGAGSTLRRAIDAAMKSEGKLERGSK